MAASVAVLKLPGLKFAPTPRPDRDGGRGPRRRRPYRPHPFVPPQPPRRGITASPRNYFGAWIARALVTALGAVLLLLGPMMLPAIAADLLRVGNVGAVAFSFVPTNVGKETGIFAKNGLDVQIIGFGGDAKLQQAMAAHAVDVGLDRKSVV